MHGKSAGHAAAPIVAVAAGLRRCVATTPAEIPAHWYAQLASRHESDFFCLIETPPRQAQRVQRHRCQAIRSLGCCQLRTQGARQHLAERPGEFRPAPEFGRGNQLIDRVLVSDRGAIASHAVEREVAAGTQTR